MTVIHEIQVTEIESEQPFYSIASLAKRLGVSERTMRAMIYRDELPWYRIGLQIRIDPADVERWLADRRHG